ncbi:MAG: folylpolyglutamate synthase/dihydrofolate synthase family protein [Bacteroidia bacterium]
MNFQQAYQYLLDRLPMFQREGKKAFKKDLSNTIAFCEALGNPQGKLKAVHVGGTNGKGSVSSMLAAVLKAAGYKTGLYTSPHLKSFTERIRLNGVSVPEAFVADFVTKHQGLIEEINPSYFETTVAMAFDYFAQSEVDIAIVEVGLGGRLDSTNIIHPLLSVITNIGWDHMDLLGDSLEKIAGEKAGIIKKHVPVIIGETQNEVKSVFEQKAQSLQAPISFADTNTHLLHLTSRSWDKQVFDYDGFGSFSLSLAGSYQQKNVLTALKAISSLQSQGWDISDKAIREGLAHVQAYSGLRGRMEVIQKKPLILADTAHNINGLNEVLAQIKTAGASSMGIVLGMVSDKEHDAILSLFPKDAQYFFVKPAIPRGLVADTLQAKAAKHELHGKTYASVTEGLQALKDWLPEDGLGFVGGSTFTVAEAV